MIILKLQGGLGNQMFQYAFASVLAKKNKTQLVFDNSFFLKEDWNQETKREFELGVFDLSNKSADLNEVNSFVKLNFFTKIKKKLNLNHKKYFKEKNFKYDSKALTITSPAYIVGYFQSYKYYQDNEGFIRRLFQFNIDKINLDNKKVLEEIKSKRTVSIHIRRGDYVTNNKTQSVHGNCSIEYYLKAINHVSQIEDKINYVFFSDDIDWVKKEFSSLKGDKIFVSGNYGSNSWIDMLLMSSCNHQIIANSSFSWWAAWLNNYNKKVVIAPKNWFAKPELNSLTNDLLPKEWIKL